MMANETLRNESCRSYQNFAKKLGKTIFLQRKKNGLSQEKLAFLSCLHLTYIGKIEQGKANPSFKTLTKIAKALKIKLSTLLKGI